MTQTRMLDMAMTVWVVPLMFVLLSCASPASKPEQSVPIVTVSIPSEDLLSGSDVLNELRDALNDDLFHGSIDLPRALPASVFGVNEERPQKANADWIALLDELIVIRDDVIANSWTVIVTGFTDSSGSTDYNQDLSARRAQQVRSTLVEELGYPADLVETVAGGIAGDGASARRVTISFVRLKD